MNSPQLQKRSEWWGQNGAVGRCGPRLGVLSSSLQLRLHLKIWLGKGQPYRAGATLCFLQCPGTLISRIPTRVWVEQR